MGLLYFIEWCDCVKKSKRLPTITQLLLGINGNIKTIKKKSYIHRLT